MAHTLTFITGLWRNLTSPPLTVSIDIDHGVPGSHLIWTIENRSDRPITLTKLIVHGPHRSAAAVPLGLPHQLAPQDRLVLPTDVDWTLLAAKSVGVVDVDGREYAAPVRQLASVRNQIRRSIDRPPGIMSARDFLFGTADLVLGAVILGLGFFMLMYAIATG
jgi:hypothetical protein